jgi:hypothetical protein
MTETNKFLDVLKKSRSTPNMVETDSFMKEITPQQVDEIFKSKCTATASKNDNNTKLHYIQHNFMDFFGDRLYDFYREMREEYSPLGFCEKVDNNGFMDIFLENFSIFEKEKYDNDEDIELESK